MSLWTMLFGGGGGGSGVEKVDGARARALVAEGAVLLDVRSPSEFAGGHLDGALNIPVDQLGGRLAEVPEGAVVVYCRSGMRSARAARVLAGAGREGVHDLGGMGAW